MKIIISLCGLAKLQYCCIHTTKYKNIATLILKAPGSDALSHLFYDLLCFREGTNLEIQVDIETKPSHLCLTTEEDLAPPTAAMAPSSGEEPQDCSSRRSGVIVDSPLCLSPGMSLREGLRDVTLAQPESIRSDLEMSDTQSDDIAELTSDDCDSPRPKSCHTAPPPQTTCRALNPTDSLHCPDNVILYVWERLNITQSQPFLSFWRFTCWFAAYSNGIQTAHETELIALLACPVWLLQARTDPLPLQKFILLFIGWCCGKCLEQQQKSSAESARPEEFPWKTNKQTMWNVVYLFFLINRGNCMICRMLVLFWSHWPGLHRWTHTVKIELGQCDGRLIWTSLADSLTWITGCLPYRQSSYTVCLTHW